MGKLDCSTLCNLPDAELLGLSHDHATAFDVLYRRHAKRTQAVVGRIIMNREDAADVVQNTFMTLLAHPPELNGDASFTTYLHRCATNRAIDFLRWKGRQPHFVGLDYAGGVAALSLTPEQAHDRRQRLDLATHAILELNPRKRAAYLFRVLDGMSLRQIGDLVDADENTVAKRVGSAHEEVLNAMNRCCGSDRSNHQ